MYQDIAVARGATYDTLNKRMDRCQENIESVSDDIQRLQGKQPCLPCPFSPLPLRPFPHCPSVLPSLV